MLFCMERDTERGDGGVHTLNGGVGDVAHDAGDGRRGRGGRRTTDDGIGQRRKKKRTRNAKPRSRKEKRKRSEKRHKKGKKDAEEFLGQKSPPVGVERETVVQPGILDIHYSIWVALGHCILRRELNYCYQPSLCCIHIPHTPMANLSLLIGQPPASVAKCTPE